MRKAIALVSSLLLVATLATPAQSAGAKYSVYQKTLAAFSSSATTLTTQQKAQVEATVEANPYAEKFICTGIGYYDQPMSVNITVRKRAKAACEYAKQLNPALSTWFQNKPTQAKSYAGKVLLTLKNPYAAKATYTPSDSPNAWLAACKDYEADISFSSPQVYATIIDDVCAVNKLDYSLVTVVASPTVDQVKLKQYVDSTVFVMSYWQSRTGLALKPLTIVAFSELDNGFWEEEVGSRVSVDIEYPSRTTKGGHCGYGDDIADAFCPKKYPSSASKDGGIVLSLLLGSQVVINRFRHLVPAHEAVHIFQDSVGQGHYTMWYVEGQATLFELALQTLFYGSAKGYNVMDRGETLDAARTDDNPFNPKTVQDVVTHVAECRNSGSAPCMGFRNGPGSVFHEKIIMDFGIDSYMTLMSVILDQERLYALEWSEGLLYRGFEEVTGVEWFSWSESSVAPYLVELYK
ncbi:hypothetical protein [Aquiluna sp. Uisw_065]|jgi:hypothetical protein|uniref:hypothetical protein n=1 Tax=Aquiluna sp. Uisw_065 TaxID=3230967 RepID=UPI0039E77CE9